MLLRRHVLGVAGVLLALAAACSRFDAADETGATGADGGLGDSARSVEADRPLRCNTADAASCVAPREVCCVRHDQRYDECIARPLVLGNGCPGQTNTSIFECASDTDCTDGVVCCDFQLQGSAYYRSECVSAPNCTGLRACDTRSVCPPGQTCRPLEGSTAYTACMP